MIATNTPAEITEIAKILGTSGPNFSFSQFQRSKNKRMRCVISKPEVIKRNKETQKRKLMLFGLSA